jgi:major vault protein
MKFMADRDTELVLAPGVHAFVLDQTKGHINTLCGPIKQSLSNTDQLVTFDKNTKRFISAAGQNVAIQTNIIAPKGYYVVLENPAASGQQPEASKAEIMPVGTLRYGQIENLPGPQSFPLWPGQVATVVKGHHLRSNQYLMVRVYDDEAAKLNWDKSIVKSVTGTDEKPPEQTAGSTVLWIDKENLVTGQLLIIQGTGVAFYIPPTGVEVLMENNEYIRDAVTLERLEYAILVGEDGNKEYKKGPDVVFPTPTQKFFTRKDGGGVQRKFRAYELQPTNGIHIKVIADYEDHVAGDEMFITGADLPIYYPREEHAIISYGGNDKSYAVAIPSGEGRYVLDRHSGAIALVTGPMMFLPNPIKEVIVRRILTSNECELYFPGNQEVQQINRTLTASGIDASSDPASIAATMARNFTPAPSIQNAYASATSATAFADQLPRSTAYSPPRMITLNTKFDGAVRIDVWSGFAVQVVNSKGVRRPVIGPRTVLLEYDEYLERLSLSTGTPKRDSSRLVTPYLRYISNPISDLLTLKTQDLVTVDLRVKYLVRFEDDEIDKWFSIDNYVQYMVDHLRSLIGNTVRTLGIQAFYNDAANILRDIVLGETDENTGTRKLKHFVENGMTVYDLEVVTVTVQDRDIAELLARSQQETLMDSISLDRAQAKTKLVTGLQLALRQQAEEVALTADAQMEINRRHVVAKDALEREEKLGEQAIASLVKVTNEIRLAMENDQKELIRKYDDLDAERQIKVEMAFAEAQKARMTAIAPRLVEAMTAMAQTGQLEAIAKHLAPLSIVQGTSLSGTLENLMRGTPLEGMLQNLGGLTRLTAAAG